MPIAIRHATLADIPAVTRIYAQSFGKDPSFAAFWRSMQAYDAALGQGDTTMVLTPDSDFFRYFQKGAGR